MVDEQLHTGYSVLSIHSVYPIVRRNYAYSKLIINEVNVVDGLVLRNTRWGGQNISHRWLPYRPHKHKIEERHSYIAVEHPLLLERYLFN